MTLDLEWKKFEKCGDDQDHYVLYGENMKSIWICEGEEKKQKRNRRGVIRLELEGTWS